MRLGFGRFYEFFDELDVVILGCEWHHQNGSVRRSIVATWLPFGKLTNGRASILFGETLGNQLCLWWIVHCQGGYQLVTWSGRSIEKRPPTAAWVSFNQLQYDLFGAGTPIVSKHEMETQPLLAIIIVTINHQNQWTEHAIIISRCH